MPLRMGAMRPTRWFLEQHSSVDQTPTLSRYNILFISYFLPSCNQLFEYRNGILHWTVQSKLGGLLQESNQPPTMPYLIARFYPETMHSYGTKRERLEILYSFFLWIIQLLLFIPLCFPQFYLQDTKSSNGTFVNNQRLSKGSEESTPREVCSGDIVQFGVDVMENSRKGISVFIF